MAKQIERNLGKDARSAFHDNKGKDVGDRTLQELKADANTIYQEYGKTPSQWMQ